MNYILQFSSFIKRTIRFQINTKGILPVLKIIQTTLEEQSTNVVKLLQIGGRNANYFVKTTHIATSSFG